MAHIVVCLCNKRREKMERMGPSVYTVQFIFLNPSLLHLDIFKLLQQVGDLSVFVAKEIFFPSRWPQRTDLGHALLIEVTQANTKISQVGVSHLSFSLPFSACIKRICNRDLDAFNKCCISYISLVMSQEDC